MMKWFLYIVKCSDGALYTGITTDIKRRIFQHNNGLGAKSLKGKLPVTLVYKEVYDNQQEAARREREIKSWRKEKKQALVEKKGSPCLPRTNVRGGVKRRRIYPERT